MKKKNSGATTLICLTIHFQLPLQNLANASRLVANAGRGVIVVQRRSEELYRVVSEENAKLKGASDGVDVVLDIQIAAAINA